MAECWGSGIATFMILGDICTRSCKFCATATGKPGKPDWDEPKNLAESVKLMKLKHCVITSVDRDDLEDGGSTLWTAAITAVKKENPGITIEALIPDFSGKQNYIQRVIDAGPDIISHNLETVRRLTPQVRSASNYERSLGVITQIAKSGITAKSGIMVGLGETEDEIFETMDDLLKVGCSVMTIGQYLQPTKTHLKVIEYIHPEIFEKWQKTGLDMGFKFIESKPLVRSSYHAEKHITGKI
jgi:lipoic acid synthetase